MRASPEHRLAAGRGGRARRARRAARARRASTPCDRCAAAGAKRSRPWNVRETRGERVVGVRELVRLRDAAVRLGGAGSAGRCRGRRRRARPRRAARAAAGRRPPRDRRPRGGRPRACTGSCSRARARPGARPAGGIPWVMSIICDSGAIRFITPWQTPTKSSWRPKSVRNVMTIGSIASTRPSRSCVAASARTLTPAARAAAVVCGPIETAGAVAPSAAVRLGRRGGGEHDQVGVGREVRPDAAAVCGRAATKSAPSSSASSGRALLRAGEEHAARRPRQLREQALLRRDAPARGRRRRSASAVAGADRGDPRAAVPRMRRRSSAAPFRLVTIDPVVAARRRPARRRAARSSISGQTTTSCPSASSRARPSSRRRGRRARDDDLHARTHYLQETRMGRARRRRPRRRRRSAARASGRPRGDERVSAAPSW